MESGEVPADVFSISLHSGYYSQRQERINLQTSDLLQEDYERSEGEIDPYDIFKVN